MRRPMWRRRRALAQRTDCASWRRSRRWRRRSLRGNSTHGLGIRNVDDASDLRARQHSATELRHRLEDHGVRDGGVALAANDDARLRETVEGDRRRRVVRRQTPDQRDTRVVEKGTQVERELAVAEGFSDGGGEDVGESLRGTARQQQTMRDDVASGLRANDRVGDGPARLRSGSARSHGGSKTAVTRDFYGEGRSRGVRRRRRGR